MSVEDMTVYELGYSDGEVVDTNGLDFDPEEYSRFKYGDGNIVDKYARLVADELVEHHEDALTDTYVASSAFKHVPTAAYAILRGVVSELAMHGYTPAGIFRIDRAVVRTNDYSALSEAERVACTENNGLVLPEVALSELAGKNALVIDDIRITGAHERALREVIGGIGLKNVLFGYIAVVDPEIARQKPETEHIINHAYVESLDDLADIASSPDFMLNARTCKFILQAPQEDVVAFISALPRDAVKNILFSMVADGYHRMNDFKESFMFFSSAVSALVKEKKESSLAESLR